MAADIFFTDTLAWSANTYLFCEIMGRAIRKCRAHENTLIQFLADATEMRLLSVGHWGDLRAKMTLTERVLEAAEEELEVLRGDAEANRPVIGQIEQLELAARTHLDGLRARWV